MSMSVGGSGVECALATPGTAINAPPASAAADPAKNFRREVIDPSLRYVSSLMYSVSFSHKATVLACLVIVIVSTRPVAPSSVRFSLRKRRTGHPRPTGAPAVAGCATGSVRPRRPLYSGQALKPLPCAWFSFRCSRAYERGDRLDHSAASFTKNLTLVDGGEDRRRPG